MSKRAARVVRALVWAALAAGAVVACANAGLPSPIQNTDDDDDAPRDAPPVHKDAMQQDAALVDASAIDAPPPVDAPDMPDASTGGVFCSDNSNCGAGTCCLIAVCVPGTPVGPKLCFPN